MTWSGASEQGGDGRAVPPPGPGVGPPAESGPFGVGTPEGWRWAVTVIRIAVAKIALDFLAGRHFWFQVLAVSVGVGCIVWWERWVGIGVLVVALIVFLVYRLVSWVIERLSMPRHVRKSLDGAKDEIRTELERLQLPTGPISGLKFAWQLVRGKHPRADLAARIKEGGRTIGPIVSGALAAAGASAPEVPAEPKGPID
jgi:hypothetical protein